MALWLRQSTASQEIPLGYMLDSTDGNTEETALTIANTDIKLWKNGATTLANKNSGGGTHISNGIYSAVLDATDTNTLGPMKIFAHVSGATAFEIEALVLPANVYDSLVAGSDALDVSLIQWLGSAPNALTSSRVDVSVGAMAANTVTATAIATDAITAAKIAADAIGASELAADAVTEIVTALLTTVLTEAYAAVGAEGTLPQLLYAIQQYLYRLSISGTTGTVGKLDGSAAATITFNSATAPTSRQRAT